MRLLRRALPGALALICAVTAGASAQHNTAAGYGGGYLSLGRLNPGAEGLPLSMDAGWVVTAFGETWHEAGGWVGARLNGAFTQRPLRIGGEERDISTWMFDGSLLLRLLPPREEAGFAPFLSAGGGLIHYGLRKGSPTAYPAEGVLYSGDDQVQLAVVAGAGLDILADAFMVIRSPLGLRLEVADHIALRSPFQSLDGGRLGPVHNVRLGISLIGLGWF